MKELLSRKWIGVVCVILTALFIGYKTGSDFTRFYENYAPQIIHEMKTFLPIVIKNGEIVKPTDTYIKKSYTFDTSSRPLDVILDTRTDNFNASLLPYGGVFVNKKCIYTVDTDEIKATCFNKVINELTVDEQFLNEKSALIEKYAGIGITVGAGLILIFVYYIVLLIYSLLTKLILAFWLKCPFSQILFINSLTYCLFEVLALIKVTNPGFLIRLAVFIIFNVLIVKRLDLEE